MNHCRTAHEFTLAQPSTRDCLAEVAASGGETIRHESPFFGCFPAVSYSSRKNEIPFGFNLEQVSEQPLTGCPCPVGPHIPWAISAPMLQAGIRQLDCYAMGLSLYTALADGSDIHEIARMKAAPLPAKMVLRWKTDPVL